MNKEEFDDWFDSAFDESVKSHDFIPDSGGSWEKVQRLLERRKRRRRLLRMLPYIAASFLLGAFIFGTPTATNAFKPLISAYTTIIEGVNRIVFGSFEDQGTVPLTAPPPDFKPGNNAPGSAADSGMGSKTTEQKSYSSPAELPDLTFDAPEIPFVPSEYVLTEVSTTRTPLDTKPSQVRYAYTRGDGMILSVNLMQMQPNSILSTGGSDDVTLKHITVHGVEAFLYLSDEGTASLEFVYDTIFVQIAGFISESDIIRMAEDMNF